MTGVGDEGVRTVALGASLDGFAPTCDVPAQSVLALADHEATLAADRLHDGPVQALVAARYAADLAVRGGDPATARDAVQLALVQLRSALWHLRPRATSDDLGGALELLSDQLTRDGGAGLALEVDEIPAGPFAALAYRLVRAVALADADQAVRVLIAQDSAGWRLGLTGGGALANRAVWSAAAAAFGGELTGQDGPPPLVDLVVREVPDVCERTPS